jgi:hypothetical protein
MAQRPGATVQLNSFSANHPVQPTVRPFYLFPLESPNKCTDKRTTAERVPNFQSPEGFLHHNSLPYNTRLRLIATEIN